LARSLAAHCQRLHRAAEGGDRAAGRRLDRLGWSGHRAGQCLIDLVAGWHRHPGMRDACDEAGCPEAAGGAVWAASWEAWWPPGKPAGELQ
jgi:hypothetical protein